MKGSPTSNSWDSTYTTRFFQFFGVDLLASIFPIPQPAVLEQCFSTYSTVDAYTVQTISQTL
eukprot:scaffold3987_cov134-Cylindrotheca_fusiformis.AAC.13